MTAVAEVTWSDIPGLKAQLSSDGRVRSTVSDSFRLIALRFNKATRTWQFSATTTDGRRATWSMARARREVFGGLVAVGGANLWSETEVAILQASSSIQAASLSLSRTVQSCAHMARRIGLTLPWKEEAGPPIRRADRSFDPLLRRYRRGVDRQVVEPLPGEEWRDYRMYGVRVSSRGRVCRIATGRLLRQAKNSSGRVSVTIMDPAKTTILVDHLVADAFKLARFNLPTAKVWTEEEDQAVRRARTLTDAATAVPGRSRDAVKLRAKALKKTFAPEYERTHGPAYGSVPFMDPLWAEASAAVPRSPDPTFRDDLISEIVLIRLEGEASTTAEALKIARRRLNKMMGTYTERSLDAPIGDSDLSMIDLLADDCERF